ncbi:hypothetical protein PQR15_31190 [Streptomyces lydicus]|nr:hypothetical protein [Streptomyces lydicus]
MPVPQLRTMRNVVALAHARSVSAIGSRSSAVACRAAISSPNRRQTISEPMR